jgi:hypothetical protein
VGEQKFSFIADGKESDNTYKITDTYFWKTPPTSTPTHMLLIVTFCGNGNQATQVASETGQKYYMAVNNADPNTPTWESCRIFFFFYLF